jgi:hypothetical protein
MDRHLTRLRYFVESFDQNQIVKKSNILDEIKA